MAKEEVKNQEVVKEPKDTKVEATEVSEKSNTGAETTEAVTTEAVKRRKARRSVPSGSIHVLASFNNTIITVTDDKGNTLTNASAGSSGFRGSKKGTAYAAQVAAEKAISAARQNYGLTKADVYVKGIGLGRDAAVRTLASQKIAIDSVKDVTGTAHGGVRPRKAKRN